MRKYLRDLASVGVILGATLAFFWKVALTNLILVGQDAFAYFYPNWDYASQMLRQGHIPLWNPYLFMGAPYQANIQAGVLYPFNWLLLWLPAPKMVCYAVVLHVFMAGVFTYFFARGALGLRPLGALVSGLVFALGGHLGAHAEHLTWLSVLAWLPLLLLLLYKAQRGGILYVCLGGLVVGLQFLAGHAQASIINLVCLTAYAVYLGLASPRGHHPWVGIVRTLRTLLLMVLLGAGLAAAQLLPSAELAYLSVRGGGLTYRQAVSFSLSPRLLLTSLLPSFAFSPFSEYIAYTGLLALVLAVWAFSRRDKPTLLFASLAVVGVFLALGLYNPFYYVLYSFVPGFGLFRVPARWLFLFSFGMSILAGIGLEAWRDGKAVGRRVELGGFLLSLALAVVAIVLFALKVSYWHLPLIWGLTVGLGLFILHWGRRERVAALVFLLVLGELFWSSRYLSYDRGTAPEAYSSLRTSVVHLLADKGLYRTLTIANTSFDPGDLAEMEGILRGQLGEAAIYDYVVATKIKEVLAPNLPLAYRISTVDGYDPLPLARFVEWQRLLLAEPSPDGQLWEHLKEIPPGALLDLMNVKYVIMDKVRDVWVDGVYYDLGLGATLQSNHGMAIEVPRFPTTAVGMVSYLSGVPQVEQGTPVAEIAVDDGERVRRYFLRAGVETAEGAGPVGHGEARVVGKKHNALEINEYYALVELGPTVPKSIEVSYILPEGELHLLGMSLVDERTGMHTSLIVSDQGRYRLSHSGDVKIYENLDVLPRAFLVHRARALNDEEALKVLADPAFDSAQEVILGQEPRPLSPGGQEGEDVVSILDYQPQRVEILVKTESSDYMVLTDAYYPGWRASVDGKPVDIERADYFFRALYLQPGQHRVELVYDPQSYRLGLGLSFVSLGVMTLGLIWGVRSRRP